MGVHVWGPAEGSLIADVEVNGYTSSDVDALHWLAAQRCDRETAAQLLLTARRRGVGDLKMYVMMLWAAVKMPTPPPPPMYHSPKYADGVPWHEFLRNVKIT